MSNNSVDSSYDYIRLRRHTMSKIIQSILDTIRWIRKANYAADLARNGKVKEAKACYASH